MRTVQRVTGGLTEVKGAVAQTSGRQRPNIDGAILETGKTRTPEVATADVIRTIMLLIAIQSRYPAKRLIHLFLDNAHYRHAKRLQAWLVPRNSDQTALCPCLLPSSRPIERLWVDAQAHGTSGSPI